MNREDLINVIEKADDLLLNDVIQAVIRRQKEIYPDWELIAFSLPAYNPEERKEFLKQILSYIERGIL